MPAGVCAAAVSANAAVRAAADRKFVNILMVRVSSVRPYSFFLSFFLFVAVVIAGREHGSSVGEGNLVPIGVMRGVLREKAFDGDHHARLNGVALHSAAHQLSGSA